MNIDNFQRSNLNQRGSQYKWHGFYRALVIDCKDPKLLGRVKIRIPDLMPEQGTDYTLDWKKNGLWAHTANNYLGGRNVQDMMKGKRSEHTDGQFQGSCLIPAEGSWVWAFFENGEPNSPYIFGALECGQRKVLPENQTGTEFWKKWTLIKTNQGRCIVISDSKEDCRVEITGKKRQIKNAPDGDLNSVFNIDDNQTVIFLDERANNEKLLIKDYKGNFIAFHTGDAVASNQLHIFFQDDIHIETEKNLYIKTGQDLHLDVGRDYFLTAGHDINTTADNDHYETADDFQRNAYLNDIRQSGLSINDSAGLDLGHAAVGTIHCGSIDNMIMSGRVVDMKGDDAVNIEGTNTLNLQSDNLNVSPNMQVAFSQAASTYPAVKSGIAELAKPAQPDGERNQDPIENSILDPIVPEGDMEPPKPIDKPPSKDGDKYELTFDEQSAELPPTPPPPTPPPIEVISDVSTTENVALKKPLLGKLILNNRVNHQIGVGYRDVLYLKDDYRDKIIPLVDKSYGTYTGFSIFREPNLLDSDYIDLKITPVYDNYRNPTTWEIDDTTKWWNNLDSFCKQAKDYDITIIPTLFDFNNNTNDPFSTKLEHPYTTFSWDDMIQGLFIKLVLQHILSSKVKFIINLLNKYYNEDPILPDSGWIRKLIMFILEQCGVPSDKLALTYGPNVNLFNRNPYCRYKMLTGNYSPNDDEINNEEPNNFKLNDYIVYLNKCTSNGIACMNNWNMNHFVSFIPSRTISINNINYLFAPVQREAMRIVNGKTEENNGFIDFL